MTLVRWLNLYPKTVDHGEMWDQQIVHWLLSPKPWSDDSATSGQLHQQGAIVILAGGFHAAETDIDRINHLLWHEPWVVYVVTSDEESKFNVDLLSHPNRKVWVQSHKPGRYDQYGKLPMGWSPHPPVYAAKTMDWSFAGQVTHSRRKEMAAVLRGLEGGKLIKTEGFTQGLPPSSYMQLLAESKIVPAPSGPATVDSFRLYEALRSGAIPILETATPTESQADYWENLFGEHPLPVVESWYELPEVLGRTLDHWPQKWAEVGEWWLSWRRDLHRRFWMSVREVGG